MKRGFAWAALAVMAVCAVYGFVEERLFAQEIWRADGIVRFLIFTAVYWAVAGPLAKFRPQWLIPAAGGFVFLYSTWWCWVFFNPWAPAAVVFFLGSCFFLGRFIARGVDAITALLIGLAIWILLLSIAMHFPVNRTWVYAVAFAVPYLTILRSPRPVWIREWPAPAWLIYVLLAHWLVALKPEVSSDGLAMHLAIPTMVARDGRWWFDFEQYTWALMPTGGDFAFTAAYLLGGEAASRLLNVALLVVISAMVFQVSRRWLSPAKASVAAALFASTPMVQLVTGSLFVENIWAALIVGAVLCWWRREVVWGALLFGAALATKVGTTAFLAPAAVAAVVWWRQARWPGMAPPHLHEQFSWRRALAGAGVLVVFAAPPYLNSWVMSHNPIFPFENKVFRSPYFEPLNSLEDVRYRKTVNWRTAYDTTFRSRGFYEGHDGAIGFQYFLLLPVFLILMRRGAPRALVGIGLAGAAITFATLPNVRYLYPALPLFSVGIAWLMAEVPWMLYVAGGLMALNLWFLPAAGWYHAEFALFTPAQMAEYRERSAPQRELVAHLNRTAPGEPVAFIRGAEIAGLDARGYSDTWHTYKFWKQMIGADDPKEIAALFREHGIHHLITPVPVLTDFAVVKKFVEEWTAPAGFAVGQFEIRNVLANPVPKLKDVTPARPGIYEDSSERIEYQGSWLHDPQFMQASGGSITYSDTPGDALRFFFEGRAIAYVYSKALNRGTAEVWIDRKLRARINQYSAQTEWQAQTVFEGLEAGVHTIEIRVMKRKDKRSSRYFVDLDRFVVSP